MTKEERALKNLKQMCSDGRYLGSGSHVPLEVLEDFEVVIKALEQELEPVYFPPCVDCQNRSKEILTAYNNMKKMQAYTKEEVITMLDKIKAEIEDWQTDIHDNEYDAEKYDFVFEPIYASIDKYKAESEGEE